MHNSKSLPTQAALKWLLILFVNLNEFSALTGIQRYYGRQSKHI